MQASNHGSELLITGIDGQTYSSQTVSIGYAVLQRVRTVSQIVSIHNLPTLPTCCYFIHVHVLSQSIYGVHVYIYG